MLVILSYELDGTYVRRCECIRGGCEVTTDMNVL